jgi:hypothetical protein
VFVTQSHRVKQFDWLSNQFFSAIAEPMLNLGVDHNNLASVIDHQHSARTSLNCQPKHAFGQAFFRYVSPQGNHQMNPLDASGVAGLFKRTRPRNQLTPPCVETRKSFVADTEKWTSHTCAATNELSNHLGQLERRTQQRFPAQFAGLLKPDFGLSVVD